MSYRASLIRFTRPLAVLAALGHLLVPTLALRSYADDDEGLVAFATTVAVGAAIANTAFTGFNVYHVVKDEPMGLGSKILTFSGIAIGATSAALAGYLTAQDIDTPSLRAMGWTVTGLGVATVGTGIWSLIVDKKQKANRASLIVTPLAANERGCIPGLTLSGSF